MNDATVTTRADTAIYLPGGATGILLAHGLAGTPVELAFVARGLARAGFTVHCCQLAGHCGTEADLVATRWQDWSRSLDAGLERLRRDCDVVLVGGLSMGALLGLHLAAQRPDAVAGLVLLAPTLWFDGWSLPWASFLLRPFIATPFAKRYKFVERHPYGIKDDRVRALVAKAMELGQSQDAGLLATPSAALRQMWLLADAAKRKLASIRAPALIIHPREDDISSLANTFYLQKGLGGLVETLVLDDSYHLITLDRQRDLVIERAASFAAWTADRARKGAPARANTAGERVAAE
jgi:carboxylesterase